MDFNEALAKAKEFTSNNHRHFKEGDEREAWEREFARRLQFEAAYNEWLQVRVDEGTDETGEKSNALNDRGWDLVHLILTTPAVFDWMIFQKFEVIGYCLTKYGEASYSELMALTALDSIKADILRHGIMSEKKAEAAA
jgi:hypothetical protein